MRQHTSDWDARFRQGDTPWDDADVPECVIQLVRQFTTPGVSVLDVGCGTGTIALWLAEQGYMVTACDVSPEAIRRALRASEQRTSDVTFIVADVLADETLPTTDIVVSRGLLHTFTAHEGRAAVATAVARHLTDHGVWLDVSGSADNLDAPGERARLGLPRVTLTELATAVEPHFEILSVRRTMYGNTPSRTDFVAWASALRRRAAGDSDR